MSEPAPTPARPGGLKARIIPLLLLRDGRMVKGKQFDNFRDVGDPVSAARIYNAQNADELVFIDIDASHEKRGTLTHIIQEVSRECFMPLTVGGGVSSIQDVRELLNSGADKVLINSAAVENPTFITEASRIFGSQCIVLGIDVKREGDGFAIYTHSGRVRTDLDLHDWVSGARALGAGEILINSIDCDGMMQGYDNELLNFVVPLTDLPVIACGGAGNFMHLVEAIQELKVHAVACASLFHFGDNNPVRARSTLKNKGIAVKNV